MCSSCGGSRSTLLLLLEVTCVLRIIPLVCLIMIRVISVLVLCTPMMVLRLVQAGLTAVQGRTCSVFVRTLLGVMTVPQFRVLMVALPAPGAMVAVVSLGLLILLIARIVQLTVAPYLLKCILQMLKVIL
ncbi:unnamed protein product [Prorocentrum cordatum]|uniref:Uncharacterized protein n=1 Tax=Prorocentrum cordatum TaxID=2364126 RepID=A0ABN9PS75_9DINO|nr:unnamed protein product [Polarella glacialis]